MKVHVAIIGTLVIVSFGLDQLSKLYVTETLQLGWGSPPYLVFPPYLQFIYAENEGINFGIPLAGRWVLIALSVAISAALLIWALRRKNISISVGAGLVIGGALGNAWDRLTHGAVIDFLNMSCCGIHNPYSFNVADIAIFGGAIWIAIRA